MKYSIVLSPDAEDDLNRMNRGVLNVYNTQLSLILAHPLSGRHMEHGLPFFSRKVEYTGGRIVYDVDEEEDIVYVARCFTSHKRYLRWAADYLRKHKKNKR